MEEKELKQIFVGKKFEKFEKKVFSIPACLFGGMYFAYRKMLLLAIIVSLVTTIFDTLAAKLLNFGLMVIATLCIHISIGLYFPIWYKKFYNNKVNKILSQNSDKSNDELIKLAQKSGNTSIAYIIIFIIINSILLSTFNSFIDLENKVSKSENISITSSLSTAESTNTNINLNEFESIKDAKVYGYSSFGKKTVLYVGEDMEQYNCKLDNPEFLSVIKDYDELSLTIYYSEDNGTKTVEGYEIYNKQTNQKLENITDENSIRELLGYYVEGDYEEELLLIEADNIPGGGLDNDTSYSYYTYVFETPDGKKLDFKYKIYENDEDKSKLLEENNKYKVKFNVTKGSFEYDYTIIDFEKI